MIAGSQRIRRSALKSSRRLDIVRKIGRKEKVRKADSLQNDTPIPRVVSDLDKLPRCAADPRPFFVFGDTAVDRKTPSRYVKSLRRAELDRWHLAS